MTSITFEELAYGHARTVSDSASADFSIVESTAIMPTNARTILARFDSVLPLRFQLSNSHTYDMSSVYPSRVRRDASAVLRSAGQYLDPSQIADEEIFSNMLDHHFQDCMPPKSSKRVQVAVRKRDLGRPLRLDERDWY